MIVTNPTVNGSKVAQNNKTKDETCNKESDFVLIWI